MLKKRLIPIMLLSDGRLIKTVNFSGERDTGDPVQAANVYSDQNADELVVLNISRRERTIDPILKLLGELSRNCFMPISIGGGIRSIQDVRVLIKSGADKVVVNSQAFRNSSLIAEIVSEFGSQALIVSIDCMKMGKEWVCFSNCGSERESVSLSDHLEISQNAGAGEFLIQSIDNDGAMLGLDLDLLRFVLGKVRIPVIGAGGIGNFHHLLEGYQTEGLDAIAAASIFHFTDSNPLRAKASLQGHHLNFKVI